MRYLITTLLFTATLALLFCTAFFLLILVKEGIYIEYLWTALGASFIQLVIIVGWGIAGRKSDLLFTKILGMLCIALAILFLLITLLLIAYLIKKAAEGKLYSETATITHYQESLIQWPGFPYPVGLHIEIELPTPFISYPAKKTYFPPPHIWMGPALTRSYAATLMSLKQISTDDQSFVSRGKQSIVAFNLYPDVIRYLNNMNQLCVDPLPFKSYYNGTTLNAAWFYSVNPPIDLSLPLSNALQSSQLNNNPTLWRHMHSQFTPAYLTQLSYHSCAIPNRSNCFCR